MVRRLSQMTEDELERYLAKIKRISKITDQEDALAELDEFISKIMELVKDENDSQEDGFGFDLPRAHRPPVETTQQAQDELLEIRQDLLHELTSPWVGEDYIDLLLNEIGENWSNKLKQEMQSQIDQLKKEISDAAKKAAIEELRKSILSSNKRVIFNVTSQNNILESLLNAEKRLAEYQALDEKLIFELRKERERCARNRATKILEKEEIARQTGKTKKAENLILEAQACFAQDWNRIFPGEPCPGV
jgi:hypothetical protein